MGFSDLNVNLNLFIGIGTKATVTVCWIIADKEYLSIFFEGSPSPIGYVGESQSGAVSVQYSNGV